MSSLVLPRLHVQACMPLSHTLFALRFLLPPLLLLLLHHALSVAAEGPGYLNKPAVAAAMAGELAAGGGIISATDFATASAAVREPLTAEVSHCAAAFASCSQSLCSSCCLLQAR